MSQPMETWTEIVTYVDGSGETFEGVGEVEIREDGLLNLWTPKNDKGEQRRIALIAVAQLRSSRRRR
jgi:hypothetical protein